MKSKLIPIPAIAVLCVSLCGCGNRSAGTINRLSQNLADTASASMIISLDLEGTISNGNSDEPYVIRVTGDGVVINGPSYQEEWRYYTDLNVLGSTSSVIYDIAGKSTEDTAYIGVIRDRSTDEWTGLTDMTDTAEDYLLTGVIDAMADNANAEEDGTYESTIDGDALVELMDAALDPNQQYDLTAYKWTGKNVPVTLTVNDDAGLPAGFTADCKIVGQQVAELVAGKTGIRITVDSFTINVSYDDYGRIAGVNLSDELDKEELFE